MEIAMSPNNAKLIIISLAEGINPTTGKHLSNRSICTTPSVIDALWVAAEVLEAMDSEKHRERTRPKNAGKPWLIRENSELLRAYDRGQPINEIALAHGRTNCAITHQLIRLGRYDSCA
jgi:hypothetical protein